MWERAKDLAKVGGTVAVFAVLVAIAMMGAGYLIDGWTDVVGQYQQEREACLRGATTFLEYDRCR